MLKNKGNNPTKRGALKAVDSLLNAVGEMSDEFQRQISARDVHAAGRAAARHAADLAEVVDSKGVHAVNGLQTSSFVVCSRIRPVLPSDLAADDGKSFPCVLAGPIRDVRTEQGLSHSEEAIVCTPKISLNGAPTIDEAASKFDFVFGPEDQNDLVYSAVGKPLVERALAGQVGVVFAYGQTGSGKTHTMNGLMDSLLEDVFRPTVVGEAPRAVSFSYLEMLGTVVTDCLVRTQPKGGVQIGEAIDGRVLTRNLSIHAAANAAELGRLVKVAQSKRSVACTARNDESSRSHGVAIVTLGPPGSKEAPEEAYAPAHGVLYIIDLAGSERAADSTNHSKERMEETKKINLSLMALKDCIRARTLASAPGAAQNAHIPYRRSKLTTLLKDVFDPGCARMCATVVIAAVSPLARDVAASANTLKYAAPLRVFAKKGAVPLERDPRDPALWTHEQTAEWLERAAADATVGSQAAEMRSLPTALDGRMGGEASAGCAARVDAAAILSGGMTGLQLCAMPEPELHRRVMAQVPGTEGSAVAKRVHSALWELIVDAKNRKRNPDGSLISEAEEEEERRKRELAQREKYDLWAQREAEMAQGGF